MRQVVGRRSGILAVAACATLVGAAPAAVASSSARRAAVRAWTDVSAQVAGAPTARSDEALAFDPPAGYSVLFGGQDIPTGTTFGDTWALIGGNWVQLHLAVSPPGRRDAAMAFDAADHYMVLFGGAGTAGGLGDTWIFRGGTWTQLATPVAPSARSYATMAYDAADQEVVLFGGLDATTNAVTSDTWAFSHGQWTQLAPATSPPARAAAGMAYDAADSTTVLFGGTSNFGSNKAGLADTWTFAGGQWTRQAPAASPANRYNFAMSFDRATRSVVAFGGWSPSAGCNNPVNDSWTYAAGQWSPVAGAEPSPRQGQRGTNDTILGGVVLFGGENGHCSVDPTSLADTWLYK